MYKPFYTGILLMSTESLTPQSVLWTIPPLLYQYIWENPSVHNWLENNRIIS